MASSSSTSSIQLDTILGVLLLVEFCLSLYVLYEQADRRFIEAALWIVRPVAGSLSGILGYASAVGSGMQDGLLWTAFALFLLGFTAVPLGQSYAHWKHLLSAGTYKSLLFWIKAGRCALEVIAFAFVVRHLWRLRRELRSMAKLFSRSRSSSSSSTSLGKQHSRKASSVGKAGRHSRKQSAAAISWMSSSAAAMTSASATGAGRSRRSSSIVEDFSGYRHAGIADGLTSRRSAGSPVATAEHASFVAQALYDFTATNANEVSFRKGQRLLILDYRGNWWRARLLPSANAASVIATPSAVAPLADRTTGFVPSNYLQVLRKARVLPMAAAFSTLPTPNANTSDEGESDPDGLGSASQGFLPVQPGQIVEVLEMPPPIFIPFASSSSSAEEDDDNDNEADDQQASSSDEEADRAERGNASAPNRTIPVVSIVGKGEADVWIVRGVDARVGPVPAAWLQLLAAPATTQNPAILTSTAATTATASSQ